MRARWPRKQDPNVMTAIEVANYLSLAPTTVLNYLRSGKLKGEKTKYGWIVTKDQMEDFLTK